jgi:hypothetical protein
MIKRTYIAGALAALSLALPGIALAAPARIVETLPQARPGYILVNDYWAWDGSGQYVLVKGGYMAERTGAVAFAPAVATVELPAVDVVAPRYYEPRVYDPLINPRWMGPLDRNRYDPLARLFDEVDPELGSRYRFNF